MHRDLLRTALLVTASGMTGWIGWSGHVLLLPTAAAFPGFWSLARTRWQALAVSAAYFLSASRGLPQGVANFYGSEIWPGILLWAIASTAFVALHAMLWADHDGLGRCLRYMILLIATALPPFGITGWAHPITAAGVLFAAWGWCGLVAMAAALGVMTTRHRAFAAIAMIGMWIWSAANWTTPKLPSSWEGVDLHLGASLGRDLSLQRQEELIDIVRGYRPASTIVLPESALGFWTPTVAQLWHITLVGTGITVIAGAAVIDETGYDNVLVKISPEGNEVLYRERMPVPGSMWQPWRGGTGQDGGARAHFFANPVVPVGDVMIAPLICYEMIVVWPILQSVFNRPDAIVAVGNGWWTTGTSIIGIQAASIEAWARLFDLPLVISFNS
ncbi:hypothetical protein ABID21_004187 [Pseudorhizobium tarimense]|uniref:CN hydrolase domain-containing protein n=1 Tax=Pseudorhizobium tarimense TaxID=1079109 RepID=A0ABV2HC59_9HYPH|nr:conjugal transfer protein TraB [Pseudorhizobium tarimense]MCJ8521172.1 conjugal transfer protein TraB [Pseudorhizobium tarimense]